MEENQKKVRSAKLIYVIEVKMLEGDGTEKDPFKVEATYWTIEGEKLCAFLNT